MRRAALIAFVSALAAFAVLSALPWLERERDFAAAITNPPPLTKVELDVIAPGKSLCMSNLTAEEHSEQARIKVGTYGRPGPELELRLAGPGYRVVRRAAGGYPDNSVVTFDVPPPARDMLVGACIRNAGRRKVALYAAADNARSRVSVTVDGKPLGASPTFGFYEREPATIARRLSLIADRMAHFRGFLGHAWLVWMVVALFTVGVPLLAGVVLWRALGPERDHRS